MTSPTYVDKAEIVATPRSRALHAALLGTLDIDPAVRRPAAPRRREVEHEPDRES
jgi:hypothetical protein